MKESTPMTKPQKPVPYLLSGTPEGKESKINFSKVPDAELTKTLVRTFDFLLALYKEVLKRGLHPKLVAKK
jgi:hypothetical protein